MLFVADLLVGLLLLVFVPVAPAFEQQQQQQPLMQKLELASILHLASSFEMQPKSGGSLAAAFVLGMAKDPNPTCS